MSEKHPPIVVDAVVKDGSIRLVNEDDYRAKCQRAARAWGNGRALRCRIEPEEDAYTYAQLKHYWGHIITPLSEWNGETKNEWHWRFKAEFLAEEKTSLTDLNRETLKEYITQVEIAAFREFPDAFALYEPNGRTA